MKTLQGAKGEVLLDVVVSDDEVLLDVMVSEGEVLLDVMVSEGDVLLDVMVSEGDVLPKCILPSISVHTHVCSHVRMCRCFLPCFLHRY